MSGQMSHTEQKICAMLVSQFMLRTGKSVFCKKYEPSQSLLHANLAATRRGQKTSGGGGGGGNKKPRGNGSNSKNGSTNPGHRLDRTVN